MKKLNSILLIDDDHASNFLHKMIIQRTNCVEHIKVCISAQKGLDYLINKDDPDYQIPDIIFLDINMPGMNGLDCISKIRSLNFNLPVILSSGSLRFEDEDLKRYKVSSKIMKPYEFDTMLDTIKQLI